MQLVLLTDIGSSALGPDIPRWVSAVQEPFLEYFPGFHGFQSPLHLVGPPATHQKEATEKA